MTIRENRARAVLLSRASIVRVRYFEVISLRRDLDTLHKILPVHAAAHKGELHPDRSVMGVIHIAEGFKDRRLVVRLCKLIIHILELDTLRPGVVVQLAQTVRVHLAER